VKACIWCVDYEAREPGALGRFASRRVFVQAKTREEAGKKALAQLHKTTSADLRAPLRITPQQEFNKYGIEYEAKK
jgi:hypothetical protein